MNKALWASISAFCMWGLFPIYWKIFNGFSAWDLFAFRLVFSFITLLLIMIFTKKFKVISLAVKDKKKFFWLVVSAILISSNLLSRIDWIFVIKKDPLSLQNKGRRSFAVPP